MKLEEQERVLQNTKKNMLLSASAGSGKTYIMIKYICHLICNKKVPLKEFLVLTFTKAAATQMKDRLLQRLREQKVDEFILEQIDALSVANISTIHSFCEKEIKKYANLLGLNENFAIVDENMSQKLKIMAFENALKNFEKTNEEQYSKLLLAFKNNKEKIQAIIFEIQELLGAVAVREDFLHKNKFECEKLFEAACDYLFDNYKEKIEQSLILVGKEHVDDFECSLRLKLKQFFNSKSLLEMIDALDDFSFPNLPKRKDVGDDVVARLQAIKDDIVSYITQIKSLNLKIQNNFLEQRFGVLEKIVLNFFEYYEVEERKIKNQQNLLDFNDLERYMSLLSTKSNLFDGFKYVFVDEYQDTNKIQEKIIKNVAKNCNFVAVGDVKQGIYGFRLASSEIFLKDLKDFNDDEDSEVNYLKSNFRSNKKVLEFINDIFKVCMTEDVCGIDYENTSKLVGVSEFLDDGMKAVYVDVVAENEEDADVIPEVYSVKNAETSSSEKNKNILNDILRRINEVMSSKISEKGVLRKCRFSDIAILSRKRDSLFNELEIFLQNHQIPVLSNSRNCLLDDVEIKVLLNYLKLALAFDDEIAILSVLTSGLYCFGLEDIAKIKKTNVIEMVKSNNLFKDFRDDLENFKLNIHIFGIKTALEKLLIQKDYFAYLNQKDEHIKLNMFVQQFLQETEKFNFDLPALINYFETVKITVSPEVTLAEDSLLLTTIHNSKGLEYPIVFLIGCEQSLSKSRPKAELEINERFGLALKFYDIESNSEIVSVRMRAIQESQSHKEFVEELMIFYVALTRAKNRLYLFGKTKDSMFERYSLKNCDSYFDLLFYCLPAFKNKLLEKGYVESENVEIVILENVDLQNVENKQNLENIVFSDEKLEKIEKYLNFSYNLDEVSNYRLKESVTSLSNKNLEEPLIKYNNDNFVFSEKSIEIGNAMHLALKIIDFEKITTLNSLKQVLNENKEFINVDLIDFEMLYKNILLLKEITKNGVVYKEKEFIMKAPIDELLESSVQDEILVQGVIDLFVVKKDEIILIDYKYSNSNNENYLIEKYKSQLKLYKKAIENTFKLKINQIYLLSLKNSKLIKINF